MERHRLGGRLIHQHLRHLRDPEHYLLSAGEMATHTCRTGGSVLHVEKEQEKVVILCPVHRLSLKDVVIEDTCIVERNGSHFQMVVLENGIKT